MKKEPDDLLCKRHLATRDEQERLRKLQNAVNKYSGLWFRTANSGSVFELDQSGWVRMFSMVDKGQIRESSKPIEIAFVDAIEAGTLIQCAFETKPVWVGERRWEKLVAMAGSIS